MLKVRRAVVERNLALCFAQRSDKRRDLLCKRYYRHYAYATWAFWWSVKASQAELEARIKITGLQYLRDAQAQGPVIVMCPHFVLAPVWVLRMFHLAERSGYVFDPHSNVLLEYLLRQARMKDRTPEPWWQRGLIGSRYDYRPATAIMHRNAPRRCLALLQQNYTVIDFPDQARRMRQKRCAPFFNQPVSVTAMIPWLVRKTGAQVVPVIISAAVGERYYLQALIQPPLAFSAADEDFSQALQTINDTIEYWAKRYPSQYLWSHRRFKREDQDVYGERDSK